MDERSIAFLKRLLDTPARSGFEPPAARVWREEAEKIADRVDADVSGNSVALINEQGAPRVMLAGHINEIGVIVTHIDMERVREAEARIEALSEELGEAP